MVSLVHTTLKIPELYSSSLSLQLTCSCQLVKQSRLGTKHNGTSQVAHLTGVLKVHILHFRLPILLSPLMYLGRWESVEGVGRICAGADGGPVPASSATRASRKAFWVKGFWFFILAICWCKMKAFTTAMSTKW